MANTYHQLYIQIVFAVRGRHNFIKETFREELQKYMAGTISAKKQKLYAIYCMPDHTHIFVSMNPDMSISKLTGEIKSGSSKFLKDKGFVKTFDWQDGFGAFSYSKSQAPRVVNYILNQPQHHKKKTFKDEYVQFLNIFEIDYNEKYLFDFYN
jgi:REP element-mobilizing transposase RayT